MTIYAVLVCDFCGVDETASPCEIENLIDDKEWHLIDTDGCEDDKHACDACFQEESDRGD